MYQVTKNGGAFDLREWGITKDADNSPALQQCLTDLVGSGVPSKVGIPGVTILVPNEFTMGTTVTINQCQVTFVGLGGSANADDYLVSLRPYEGITSVFRWIGADNQDMFLYTDTLFPTWKDVRFENLVGATNVVAHHFLNTPAVTESIGTNKGGNFIDCHFGAWVWSTQGTSTSNGFGTAVLVDGDNANNDRKRFVRCTFRDNIVGVDMPNSQSVWGSFTDCDFIYGTTGIIADCQIQGNNVTLTDLDVGLQGSGTARFNITNLNSELCKKLAVLTGHATLHVTGGYTQAGTPLVENNWVDASTSTIAGRSKVTFDNHRFSSSSDAYPVGQIVGNAVDYPVTLRDCMYVGIDKKELFGTTPPSEIPKKQEYRIETLANRTYKFLADEANYKIISIAIVSESGTANAAFTLGGSGLDGSAYVFSTTKQKQTHYANETASGGSLFMAITNNSACIGAIIVIKYVTL